MRWLLTAALVLLVLFAALPWGLETDLGRDWLCSRADRLLKQNHLAVSELHISWFGATRARGLVIRSPSGTTLLTAGEVTADSNLAEILWPGRGWSGQVRLVDVTVELSEQVAPDYGNLIEAIRQHLGQNAAPGLRVDISNGTFHFRNPGGDELITANWSGAIVVPDTAASPQADIKVAIKDVSEFHGLHLGPTTVDLQVRPEGITINPIETTLNNGRLYLEPLVRSDRDGSVILALGPGSKIERIQITPRLASDVLSYVLIILRDVTEVRGIVSADIRRAEYPLASGKEAVFEAYLQLRVVCRPGKQLALLRDEAKRALAKELPLVFEAGPLDDLLAAASEVKLPLLTIEGPVKVTVFHGLVVQEDLTIPLGPFMAADFRGNLSTEGVVSLVASCYVRPEILDGPLFALALPGMRQRRKELLKKLRIEIPISGTLENPRVGPPLQKSTP